MRPFDYLLYAGVLVGWSTSWYPLSLQVNGIAPEVSLVWRFLLAALLMTGFTMSRGVGLKFPWRDHLSFMGMGISLFSSNFCLFYYASLFTASGLLAVMFSMASLINVLMVAALTKTAPPRLQLGAALIGILGVAVIFLPEIQVAGTAWIAAALCTVGTLFFCTGNMISAATQRRGIPVLASTSWGMFYGACFMMLVATLRGHEFTIDMSASYIGSLLWLVVVSSVITFGCYLSLVGSIGASRAAYATVVFPIFALAISTVLEGYSWSLLSVGGLALVIAGNLMMIRSRN